MGEDEPGVFNYPDIRRQLAWACETPSSRTHVWRPNIPTEWQPNTVINPETKSHDFPSGIPFSEDAAWRFVAALLRQGWPLERKNLDHPPNTVGYEMKVLISERVLYIKVALWKGGVYGRSFHLSTRS